MKVNSHILFQLVLNLCFCVNVQQVTSEQVNVTCSDQGSKGSYSRRGQHDNSCHHQLYSWDSNMEQSESVLESS